MISLNSNNRRSTGMEDKSIVEETPKEVRQFPQRERLSKVRAQETIKRLLTKKRATNERSHTYLSRVLDNARVMKLIFLLCYGLGMITFMRLLLIDYSYTFSNWLFIKLLGVVYLAAFTSFWVQVDGLIGDQGIIPVRQTLRMLSDYLADPKSEEDEEEYTSKQSKLYDSVRKFLKMPTLFWFIEPNSKNVHRLCYLGTLCSIGLIIGIVPAPLLFFTIYLIYLTFETMSDVFLALQWDILMLETAFLSTFLTLSSHGFKLFHFFPSQVSEPSRIMLFLIWWLLFKLMFSSGLVKLTSRDTSWSSLEAMSYHYQTQPIPGPLSHYFHNLPKKFHKIETLGTFFIELVLPFAMFGPRLAQYSASIGFSLLNALISTTGNYGFFNILTIALSFSLFDDTFFGWNSKQNWEPKLITLIYEIPIFILLFSLSIIPFNRAFRSQVIHVPDILSKIAKVTQPFYIMNPYGLFAVMTTERIELVIEGSLDGENWETYEFKYKPGDLKRMPPFILGHMPRLDWRFWFLPFQKFPNVPSWFIQFLEHIKDGNPVVLQLLDSIPFPANQPPLYLRVLMYDYRFTTRERLKETGAYWTRSQTGMYIPFVFTQRK